ncbi:hypothetical protein QUF81_21200 [Peribacillus simplex]|jgi:uncharacterized Zn finger protein|uniref:Uncharacterized protein n=2 Tax=Peribacillus TaxID=2675229 RepID=A0AA90SH58_9BACI|nr:MULTISPECIES: hypothetical protein [Peribacillus]SNS94733.1 hypothetical protein SAMN05444672_10448 [Bacillus sp. OK838]MDF9762585.1 putative Zn finger protein [Peribacillus simplex]MDM5213559.1 hypothetical protein [Peribacillus sp. NJ4]MDM5223933.1 hypothetical protein [Peribacillus sp. NJ11]MDM5295632.1 hypothetical protein [Peribacillus simplex]
MKNPMVICPVCGEEREMENVLTAQSNQNVIYQCPECGFKQVNIKTSKG